MARLILVVVLVAGCATTQRQATEPPLGTVVCLSDKHYDFYRGDALRSVESNAILAHEQHHLMQARMFGGCDAWQKFIDVPANRARAEAAAFCVSAAVALHERRFLTLSDAVRYYGATLSQYPTLSLDQAAAERLIWTFCR